MRCRWIVRRQRLMFDATGVMHLMRARMAAGTIHHPPHAKRRADKGSEQNEGKNETDDAHIVEIGFQRRRHKNDK